MAAGIIQFDRNTEPMRQIVRAVQLIREGVKLLQEQRAVLIQFCDGATNVAANWDLLAAAGSFAIGDYASANAAAMAAFSEIDSLHSKLTTDAQVASVNAAILQAPAKLGV